MEMMGEAKAHELAAEVASAAQLVVGEEADEPAVEVAAVWQGMAAAAASERCLAVEPQSHHQVTAVPQQINASSVRRRLTLLSSS